MLETKDPAIKLFGKKIAVPADDEALAVFNGELAEQQWEKEEETETDNKDSPQRTATENTEQDSDSPPETEDSINLESSPDSNNVNPKTPSIDEEGGKSKVVASTDKEQQNDPNAANSQEKTLKKPDKILPCPRCNSMDTKFCYYNNYNVNQPRHFCKACQRYWTAGGTMRNVPVGAGRRKNKNTSTHYRHITISEALQAARVDAAPQNGTHHHHHHHHHHPALKSNGRVLSFGLDSPICDSMASVLNLADNTKKALNGNSPRNGFPKTEERAFPGPCKGRENGDDCSSASSITVANSMDEVGRSCPQEPQVQNMNGFSSIPCLPGVPWPYPWNSAVPPPPPPPPPFCPPGFPMSFYPAAYWNCAVPGAWNIPWPFPPPQPSSPSHKSPSSGSNSPTLGKRSRDEEILAKTDTWEKEEPPKQRNGSVLIPKTLRIDDPTEAAKSSIWATLGIKNDGISGGGMFKAFQSKTDEKKQNIAETSPVLRANPAALSRSLKFHESL